MWCGMLNCAGIPGVNGEGGCFFFLFFYKVMVGGAEGECWVSVGSSSFFFY